ncbi:hypothetical protein N7493_003373 [Penicillium malachiteum]|uniref:BZIP domain-containing protein n=1 Tax=Penicillium malachiteum TaxID=1324776 RepID=A0AAD6HQ31_9EURO|nr:hypothetical protein N7493_003373 [Penicillium malachiteum]
MVDLSPTERKRQRDRRAQQNLRDKKLRYTTNLEQQVAHCEQHHDEKGVKRLFEVITGLRKQNEALLARQATLKSLVSSWDDTVQATNAPSPWLAQGVHSGEPGNLTPGPIPQDSVPPTMVRNVSSPNMSVETSPWNKLPLYSDDFSDIKTVSCPWFAYPDKINSCPDTPSSPLDILYGSQTNTLANMIHLALERRPIRDPERLAIGWIVYHFSRWIVAPSPATYERLPSFLRPTEDQLTTPHPMALSGIPWPQVRSNMIRQWHIYDLNREEFFGMFGCCIKIRWPWGVKVLERTDDNQLRIKPAFYETFMREEGWGITPEFISRFPDLMTDVDVDKIVFTM